MKIEGKAIIVTGASSGIGLAIARELAARGAKVALAARSKEKLEGLAAGILGSIAIPADLRDERSIRALVKNTLDRFGRIDVLVNNAGQGLRASVEAIDLDEYRSIMELNVFGALAAMQHVIPLMRTQGGGTIVNISSMLSKAYIPGLSAYASTKYALNCLSLTARAELASDHIVVSAFHPKLTATDFGTNALGAPYNSRAGRPGIGVDTPEAVARAVADLIETGEPEAHM